MENDKRLGTRVSHADEERLLMGNEWENVTTNEDKSWKSLADGTPDTITIISKLNNSLYLTLIVKLTEKYKYICISSKITRVCFL